MEEKIAYLMKVRKYYAEEGMREWRRLVKDPYHRLEYDTTMHFLERYLPSKGLILDAGGGPGRYTIELARRGYRMVLLDLTPELLKIAKRRIRRAGIQAMVEGIVEGTITNLSIFNDECFDAVLCLGGVLSHLVRKSDRVKAIAELSRVVKRGAPLFISVIGRLAVLMRGLADFPDLICEDVFIKIRDSGDYYGKRGFAPCHFYLPEELIKELKDQGLELLKIVGLEGIASTRRREINRLYRKIPKAYKIWWKTHLKTCTHPGAIAISEHILAVCTKP